MGLFPKLCFTKLMLERKDKPLLVNRDYLRDWIAAACVDMCTSAGFKAKVSSSIHLPQHFPGEVQAQPHQSVLLTLKTRTFVTFARLERYTEIIIE